MDSLRTAHGHGGLVPLQPGHQRATSVNANNVSDEFGEFDDWVELFNAGSTPVALGGKYLTDNLGDPDKFALPAETLAAGDWAFYWADNDLSRDPTTRRSPSAAVAMRWRCSSGMRTVRWSSWTSSPLVPEQDASLGRYLDVRHWVWFATPTANATNNYAIILDQQELEAVRFGSLRRTPRRTGFAGRETGGRPSPDAAGREVLRFPQAEASHRRTPGGVYVLRWTTGPAAHCEAD